MPSGRIELDLKLGDHMVERTIGRRSKTDFSTLAFYLLGSARNLNHAVLGEDDGSVGKNVHDIIAQLFRSAAAFHRLKSHRDIFIRTQRCSATAYLIEKHEGVWRRRLIRGIQMGLVSVEKSITFREGSNRDIGPFLAAIGARRKSTIGYVAMTTGAVRRGLRSDDGWPNQQGDDQP